MFRRAQDRIRSYFYKTKEELKNRNLPPHKLDKFLRLLLDKLRAFEFFGCYFDRRFSVGDPKIRSICDDTGKFLCQGRWDKDTCLYQSGHQINPYKNREERVIFQTWNLDHVIERSRSIIPAICEALAEGEEKYNGDIERVIDVDGIFRDLFTRNNLKFVHIVCHDKGAHQNRAGPYFI